MTPTREHLVDWLRDAHAMEQTAAQLLERQTERIESYPELHQKVREHLDVTRRQAEQVAQCIQRLDGDSSTLKDSAAKFAGNVGALFNSGAADEVVKNGIGDYAFEHFEIASYRALVAAAEALGETEVARVCRNILREEEEMAHWLEQHLPQVTQQFLQRDEADVQAKR